MASARVPGWLSRVALAFLVACVGAVLWFAWSIWSAEAAIRAASVPAEGVIVVKRQHTSAGGTGRYGGPSVTTYEVEVVVAKGAPDTPPTRQGTTSFEAGLAATSLSRQVDRIEDALDEAAAAAVAPPASATPTTGGADGGDPFAALEAEIDRLSAEIEAATGGGSPAPPASRSPSASPAALSPGDLYVISFESYFDPGEVGQTIPLLIYPPDTDLSARGDFVGKWNASLYKIGWMALLLLILAVAAFFGMRRRSA